MLYDSKTFLEPDLYSTPFYADFILTVQGYVQGF